MLVCLNACVYLKVYLRIFLFQKLIHDPTETNNLYSFELVAPGSSEYKFTRSERETQAIWKISVKRRTIEKIKVSKTEECNRKKDYRAAECEKKEKNKTPRNETKQYKRTIMMMTMLILLAIAFVQ